MLTRYDRMINDISKRVAEALPPGYEIRLHISAEESSLTLVDPEGEDVDYASEGILDLCECAIDLEEDK